LIATLARPVATVVPHCSFLELAQKSQWNRVKDWNRVYGLDAFTIWLDRVVNWMDRTSCDIECWLFGTLLCSVGVGSHEHAIRRLADIATVNRQSKIGNRQCFWLLLFDPPRRLCL